MEFLVMRVVQLGMVPALGPRRAMKLRPILKLAMGHALETIRAMKHGDILRTVRAQNGDYNCDGYGYDEEPPDNYVMGDKCLQCRICCLLQLCARCWRQSMQPV